MRTLKDTECHHCTKRYVGCHDNCDYWIGHEAKKLVKYDKGLKKFTSQQVFRDHKKRVTR